MALTKQWKLTSRGKIDYCKLDPAVVSMGLECVMMMLAIVMMMAAVAMPIVMLMVLTMVMVMAIVLMELVMAP